MLWSYDINKCLLRLVEAQEKVDGHTHRANMSLLTFIYTDLIKRLEKVYGPKYNVEMSTLFRDF